MIWCIVLALSSLFIVWIKNSGVSPLSANVISSVSLFEIPRDRCNHSRSDSCEMTKDTSAMCLTVRVQRQKSIEKSGKTHNSWYWVPFFSDDLLDGASVSIPQDTHWRFEWSYMTVATDCEGIGWKSPHTKLTARTVARAKCNQSSQHHRCSKKASCDLQTHATWTNNSWPSL